MGETQKGYFFLDAAFLVVAFFAGLAAFLGAAFLVAMGTLL
jgi:hypothetical protein